MNVSVHDDSVLELNETFDVLVELGTTAARTNVSLNETRLQTTIVDEETGQSRHQNHVLVSTVAYIYRENNILSFNFSE